VSQPNDEVRSPGADGASRCCIAVLLSGGCLLSIIGLVVATAGPCGPFILVYAVEVAFSNPIVPLLLILAMVGGITWWLLSTSGTTDE